jgi:hypothetical protein
VLPSRTLDKGGCITRYSCAREAPTLGSFDHSRVVPLAGVPLRSTQCLPCGLSICSSILTQVVNVSGEKGDN